MKLFPACVRDLRFVSSLPAPAQESGRLARSRRPVPSTPRHITIDDTSKSATSPTETEPRSSGRLWFRTLMLTEDNNDAASLGGLHSWRRCHPLTAEGVLPPATRA